ncbi:MAG: hypothetical protein DMG90_07440 [Acidobacteria bacterium]|nr:MAG: hypothetical protein DMG90_07440 [Acidobacteriota bacterium]
MHCSAFIWQFPILQGGVVLGKSLRVLSFVMLLAVLVAAETIPAGTRITMRTQSQINSGSARSGQSFNGTLARDLVVNGRVLARAGAPVRGTVTFAKSSGRLHEPGELALRLSSVEVNGRMVPVKTSAFHAKGKSHTKSNVTKIGGGAAAGALIGGLVGGGKGALIGTAAGAGAGTGVAAATGKQEAVVHAESALTFTLSSPASTR